MALASEVIDNIVPISAFSRGGAAQAFAKARPGVPVTVVKNNTPIGIICTPDDYARLLEIEKNYILLREVTQTDPDAV